MARFPIILACGLVAACGPAAQLDPSPQRDPAIMAALAEPLLSDPDLAGSQTPTILTGGGPAQGWVPLFGPDDQEAARARAEAAAMFGGGEVPPAPPVRAEQRWPTLPHLPTAAFVAAQLPFAAPCAASLRYSFGWAAQMPEAVPLYPRSHVQEAAGSDQDGCRLRVVNFRTPVTPEDVVAFYHGVGSGNALAPRITRAGNDLVVSGEGGGQTFVVYVRARPDGTAEADLVTSG